MGAGDGASAVFPLPSQGRIRAAPRRARSLEEIREEWRVHALSAEPADRPRAERAYADLYRAGGLPPPRRFVWMESPLAGALLVFSLSARGNADESRVEGVLESAGSPVSVRVWEKFQDLRDLRTGQDLPAQLLAGATVLAERSVTPWEANLVHLRVRGPLYREVAWRIRDPFFARVRSVVGWRMRHPFFGQHDSARLGGAVACLEINGGEPRGALAALVEGAASAGWAWLMGDLAVATERPRELRMDRSRRLHGEDGPAMRYADGFGVWAWHGVAVPREVVIDPGSLTVSRIEREPNLEVRRVMIERFGENRFLGESGSVLVQSDDSGGLYRREGVGGEAMVFVKVRNSTPEPDGTRRDYWLRVPPDTRTARAGVAWTFGMHEKEYNPRREA